MVGNLLVSLQAIANNGQAFFLLFISVAILCGDPGNPSFTAAVAAAANSVSQQACQSDGCIFHMSSGLYVHIKLMEFKLGLNVNQRYTEICRLLNKSCTAPFTRGYFKSPIIEHYPEESGNQSWDTAQIERNFGGGGSPKVIATNHSINFTFSYGDEIKFFNISMIFWKDMDRHNWSLVMVSYQSSNDFWGYRRGENEYDYEDDDYYYGNEDYYVEDDGRLIHQYPFWIGANENTAFSCNMLAGVSNNTKSELYIHNVTMQPFNANKNPPSKVTDCRASNSHRNNDTILILGAVAGAAVVIAIIIVISTYFYRQRKRGKYNLLD